MVLVENHTLRKNPANHWKPFLFLITGLHKFFICVGELYMALESSEGNSGPVGFKDGGGPSQCTSSAVALDLKTPEELREETLRHPSQ